MSIEDRYLSGLVSVQFPDAPIAQDVQLAAGPSDTMTDAGPARIELNGMATPDKTPRVGRAGVPMQKPSMRDITEPAGAMLDMGAATVKGAVQGFAGLPGDLEGIGRLLLGAMGVQAGEKTVLPTTDEVKAWLDTKVGKVGDGKNPYESMGEVVAPGGQIKAAKAAGRGAKALAPKAAEMVIDSMEKLGTPVKIDLMAYHGTPHKVDKFDSKKIGTGEGAQAYGYGLYFAENRGVADGYRVSLSYDADKMKIGGKQINAVYDQIQKAAARIPYAQASGEYEKLELLERLMMNDTIDDVQEVAADMSPSTKAWFEKTVKPSFETYGNLYTVDIPDEMAKKMLDFDKPIGEQSPEIQALAKKYKIDMTDLGGDLLAAARGKTPKGAQIMREAGIPGVRYLDQGSKGSNAGSRNLVVFPGGEDQIKILKQEGTK